jgi:hypothetical protein
MSKKTPSHVLRTVKTWRLKLATVTPSILRNFQRLQETHEETIGATDVRGAEGEGGDWEKAEEIKEAAAVAAVVVRVALALVLAVVLVLAEKAVGDLEWPGVHTTSLSAPWPSIRSNNCFCVIYFRPVSYISPGWLVHSKMVFVS